MSYIIDCNYFTKFLNFSLDIFGFVLYSKIKKKISKTIKGTTYVLTYVILKLDGFEFIVNGGNYFINLCIIA